jgi:hypothetical protein
MACFPSKFEKIGERPNKSEKKGFESNLGVSVVRGTDKEIDGLVVF